MRIASIISESIVDGPGYRMTVFVQGCPHHCPGCHNPQTWDPAGGTEMDTAEIAALYLQNPLLDGITLSGGEPFGQVTACLDLLGKLPGVNVWCYTGYTIEQLITRHDEATTQLLMRIDTLVDGPYIQEQRTLALPWRGSKNQRIIQQSVLETTSSSRPR